MISLLFLVVALAGSNQAKYQDETMSASSAGAASASVSMKSAASSIYSSESIHGTVPPPSGRMTIQTAAPSQDRSAPGVVESLSESRYSSYSHSHSWSGMSAKPSATSTRAPGGICHGKFGPLPPNNITVPSDLTVVMAFKAIGIQTFSCVNGTSIHNRTDTELFHPSYTSSVGKCNVTDTETTRLYGLNIVSTDLFLQGTAFGYQPLTEAGTGSMVPLIGDHDSVNTTIRTDTLGPFNSSLVCTETTSIQFSAFIWVYSKTPLTCEMPYVFNTDTPRSGASAALISSGSAASAFWASATPPSIGSSAPISGKAYASLSSGTPATTTTLKKRMSRTKKSTSHSKSKHSASPSASFCSESAISSGSLSGSLSKSAPTAAAATTY